MDLRKIDSNFVNATVSRDDVIWYDAKKTPFSLHGIYFDKSEERFRRMPHDIALQINEYVDYLSAMTAGGRLRFITDSPFVAIKCVLGPETQSTSAASSGFAVYKDQSFCGVIYPNREQFNSASDNKIIFDGLRMPCNKGLGTIELDFPHHNGVYELYIGLQQGSKIQAANNYSYKKPVVFYGSSITQGWSVSRTGNSYIDLLSKKLDFDYINLGFAGRAKAEKEMVDYLASLDVSAYVFDYDHNAPTIEHLQATYPYLYNTIRKMHPKTPILMLSQPNFDSNPATAKNRRDYIRSIYINAKKSGDKFVFFVDGEKLFGKHDRESCTADCVHPNDLGFYRMYQTILPTMKKVIKRSVQ
ncbi:MAG: hypothetical protein E7373_06755 [Clostridiales bacterium]|nr:hypothetical protein [Clostridiales bacterium]